jgi:micrococcal nuclease
MRRLALLVLVAAVLLALPRMIDTSALPTQVTDLIGTTDAERTRAVVVRVTDGDTLRVRVPGGREEAVRVLGIDTPEVHPELECGGLEATSALERLAPVGSKVVLVSDPTQADRDRYDRLLRYVGRSGDDVGLAQVTSGHAQVFVFRDDPFERNRAYQRAERTARQDGRASWARCWG